MLLEKYYQANVGLLNNNKIIFTKVVDIFDNLLYNSKCSQEITIEENIKKKWRNLL